MNQLKKILEQGEIEKLLLRLDALKYGNNKDDNDNEGRGGRGGSGNDDNDGTPGQGPNLSKKTLEQEMEEITRRLHFL